MEFKGVTFGIKKGNEGGGFLVNLRNKLGSVRESLYLDNDLLFILTYMASISTAQINRDKIFEKASQKKEYAPSKFFSKIRKLTQEWYYDYASACELIAEKVSHERFRNLLNRFSNAIKAGEPDAEFLENEWKTFKTIRKDEYERNLESLKKWADAFTALMVSSSLISIIILLSVIIYKIGTPEQTLFSSAMLVFIISIFGVGMLYKSVPKDLKNHNLVFKSREQYLISKWGPVSFILACMILITITLIPTFFKPDLFIFNGVDFKGLGFLIAGIVLFPIGLIARKDDINISKRDESFTPFVRNLGAIISGAGVSVVEALTKIDQKNLGELKDSVYKLYKRLAMGLDPILCWERFVGETGSYLIYKLTNIFVDAVDLGGDAGAVGELVSSSNLEMVLLRMKRDLISSGFVGLIVPLHLAMSGLFMFITQILTIFTQLISSLFVEYGISGRELKDTPGLVGGMNMGIFSGVPLELLGKYSITVILIMTITNTFAAKIVKGGGNYLLYYYGAMMCILSGIVVLVVPPLVDIMFSFPQFGGGGT